MTQSDFLSTPSSTHNADYDLVVVGAGSGGLAAAKQAAALGAKVAICERQRVGGTCVLRGCVPKKLMVHAAHLGLQRRLCAAAGWSAEPDAPRLHWPTLCQKRDQVVDSLNRSHSKALADAGIDVLMGAATLLDAHTVSVGSARVRARYILWASGSQPMLPQVPGGDHLIDSDGFFALPQCPKQAVVLGGGYIAVELACVMAGLGAQVTLMVRSQLLRQFDVDLRRGQAAGLAILGIEVLEGHRLVAVQRRDANQLQVIAEHGPPGQVQQVHRTAEATVLCATGRRPNTDHSGLAEAGVRLAANGAIEVDDSHRTTLPNIYAVGDVIDRVNLTPVAIAAGRQVARRLFADDPAVISYDNIPTAVFGVPAIGSVGMSQSEAEAALGQRLEVYQSSFAPLTHSITAPMQQPRSMAKVLVDAVSRKVVGMHLLAADAPEIIQGFAAAITAGITKEQLDQTRAVHPTVAEELVLMRRQRA